MALATCSACGADLRDAMLLDGMCPSCLMRLGIEKGARLGPFEIVGPLGVGGMGEVYRAKDTKLGRIVAIKVLREDLISDTERLWRFKQEARSASALNHPNIVTIYEIGEHEGTPYIAMELVEGQSLREMIADGSLPNDKLIRYATQMAEGLAKAHRAGIVHRDLKPENIVVSDDGYVKILDFGLAKLAPNGVVGSETSTVAGETTPGVILGTVGYMSPEQAKGEPADFRSDQFSLGAILYEMATGKRAFERESATQTLNAIIENDPELVTLVNPKIAATTARVIARCLSKDPNERYDSTWDIAKDIEWVGGDVEAPTIDSIAVLPLENLSSDPEQQYFADGMTDELISQLAQIQSLRVISRTSIMQYKGVRKPLPEIGQELDVDVVVEGTVRRAEGRVRITAELVETATDRHLWAQSFERELRDVLTLQSEMAHAIAQEIRVTLTPQEVERFASEQTTDAEAYEAYLKGMYHFRKSDEVGFKRALEYFDDALEMDPKFALAYAGRAATYINLELWAALRPGEGFGEARQAALRAVELDETLAEAHLALAIVHFRHDWDFGKAESAFRRAMALNPSYADAHSQYSYLLGSTGRRSEAIEEAQNALNLDPLSPLSWWVLAVSYRTARLYEQALSASRKMSGNWPGVWSSPYGLAQTYTVMERLPEARRAAEKSVAVSSRNTWTLAQLGSIHGLMGREVDARVILTELEEKRRRQHVPALALAWVNMGLGDKDRAVEWLEIAYEEREGWLVDVYPWPLWDSLHDHPGFIDIFRRMGLPM